MGQGRDRERPDDAGEGVHVQHADVSVHRDEDPPGNVGGQGDHAGVERALGQGRPRRRLKAVHAPTRAAPTGPTRTAAAKVAVVFADQERSPGLKRVAVDSERTSSKPRIAISRHEFPGNAKGPQAITAAAAATTAAI